MYQMKSEITRRFYLENLYIRMLKPKQHCPNWFVLLYKLLHMVKR